MKFTRKVFFYTKLGFTQSHSGQLGDMKSLIEKLSDTYKKEKPNNFTELIQIFKIVFVLMEVL